MAAKRTDGRHSQGCDLRSVRGGQTGSTETSRPDRARPLLRAEVPRVPVADDLESVERLHIRLEGTGPDSSIQGDCETGRVPGDSLLAVSRRNLQSSASSYVLICFTSSACAESESFMVWHDICRYDFTRGKATGSPSLRPDFQILLNSIP